MLLLNGNPAPDPLESESLYLKAALTATEERPEEGKKADGPVGRYSRPPSGAGTMSSSCALE